MPQKTRRDFLAITAASAASVPFMRSFSSAAHAPAEEQTAIGKTPGGTVAVRLRTGAQRYSPSQSLVWHNADRASGENTIMLGAAGNRQPILGFGAAFTDAACYVIHQMPEAERERLLQELFHPDQMALSVGRMWIGSIDSAQTCYGD